MYLVVSIGWSSILSLFGEASVCVVSLMLIFRVWYCVSVESGNNFIDHSLNDICSWSPIYISGLVLWNSLVSPQSNWKGIVGSCQTSLQTHQLAKCVILSIRNDDTPILMKERVPSDLWHHIGSLFELFQCFPVPWEISSESVDVPCAGILFSPRRVLVLDTPSKVVAVPWTHAFFLLEKSLFQNRN
jgi:hypothetical protein